MTWWHIHRYTWDEPLELSFSGKRQLGQLGKCECGMVKARKVTYFGGAW